MSDPGNKLKIVRAKHQKLYVATILLIVILVITSILNITPFLQPTVAIIISVIIITGYMKFTHSSWSMIGLNKKFLLPKSIFYAIGLALIISFTFFFIIIPVIEVATKYPLDYSLFEELTKDTKTTIIIIPVIWITAALFEEIIFRGFFITYNFKLINSQFLLILSIIFSSILFGFAHSYQGITGIVVTGMVGFILSIILVKKHYNLFFLIMIHAFIDTIYILIFYFDYNDLHLF